MTTRPKSAPTRARLSDGEEEGVGLADEEGDEEEESFDWETGNHALKGLEEKLKAFYARNEPRGGSGRKSQPSVVELKRFNVQVRINSLTFHR